MSFIFLQHSTHGNAEGLVVCFIAMATDIRPVDPLTVEILIQYQTESMRKISRILVLFTPRIYNSHAMKGMEKNRRALHSVAFAAIQAAQARFLKCRFWV
ncbi:hypothetical protein XU18_2922 [Perkinsela sp. CCAP 1560/4]|nr:hypothetical protein XU18_2922 [Perkinsela sp. CCAP 1560/4]|eukprot:KNH06417.1 hypothetical protein XU18_2922 [Perkinsela sp. CCAP 1560/4]